MKQTLGYQPEGSILDEYELLAKKIKFYLPMKAYPTIELVNKIKAQRPGIHVDSEFFVADVFNSGDLSGILCVIQCDDAHDLMCSLTHIEIDESEPLMPEILEYQLKRLKRVDIQYKQTNN